MSDRYRRLLGLHAEMARKLAVARKERAEQSLYEFLTHAWPYLDPAPFVGNWHLGAMAEHLEAVSNGEIKRLVINIPPRHGKTSLVTICWPTWTWIQDYDEDFPLKGPQVAFLCASYGAQKAQEDGVSARRLIGSDWFQKIWGDKVVIAKDRDNQERFDNTAGGSRINTGIPESLGKGGLIRILDDPHKTKEVESQTVREGVIRAYDEVWRTRSNSASVGAEVLVMQRLAADDLTGHLLEEDVVHLCLPARFESRRICVTPIGFVDPRSEDGEMLWPGRFPVEWATAHEKGIGPFAWASQYQQIPQSRGGTIIKEDWWQDWTAPQFPSMNYILASLDTGMTEKDSSDPSALTIWGSFEDGGQIAGDEYNGYDFIQAPEAAAGRETVLNGALPKVMLMNAWQDRLELPDLVERVLLSWKRWRFATLVIENKAHGHAVLQSLRSMFSHKPFSILMFDPKRYGDKTNRLYAVQHLFSEGIVWAPKEKTWAEEVIHQMAMFPNGAHDDLADSASQGLIVMRQRGMMPRKEEVIRDTIGGLRHKPRAQPLYPA